MQIMQINTFYVEPIIVSACQGDGYSDNIPTTCDTCKLWSRCRGGYRAASEQLYGTFDKVDSIIFDSIDIKHTNRK